MIFPMHTSCDYDTWSFMHARTHACTHAYVKLDPVQSLSQTQRCDVKQSEYACSRQPSIIATAPCPLWSSSPVNTIGTSVNSATCKNPSDQIHFWKCSDLGPDATPACVYTHM